MKLGAAILAIAAFITGCISARYWYRSSQTSPLGFLADMVGGDGLEQANLLRLRSMADESANLNEWAAKWTAGAVFLGTLANLIEMAS